ncbi:MAG TPA: hypothetical protein VLM44_06415 [Lutibacter sp.]|nr:hypothetical protein [Lutibacter sp.]
MRTIKKISNNRFFLVMLLLVLTINFNSCTDDLDKIPTNTLTNDKQFSSVEGYKQGGIGLFQSCLQYIFEILLEYARVFYRYGC